jgi:peptidoglycan/xylan/chitin deacetylase (PgdA/CDA1 family)
MKTHTQAPGASTIKIAQIPGVSVFVYHGVGLSASKQSLPYRKYWISSDQFGEQLREIGHLGFRVVRLQDFQACVEHPKDLLKTTVLTFDDGQATDYEQVFPLLSLAGIPADFFVSTARIGQKGYLTWTQLREMQDHGMSVHSHGHEHVDISRMSQSGLIQQLKVSKTLLEDALGCSVKCFAVPYGLVNRRVLEAARSVGFETICTSRQWPAVPGNFCVNRTGVYGHTCISEFRQLLLRRPWPYIRRSIRAACVFLPRSILLRVQPSRLGVLVAEEQL